MSHYHSPVHLWYLIQIQPYQNLKGVKEAILATFLVHVISELKVTIIRQHLWVLLNIGAFSYYFLSSVLFVQGDIILIFTCGSERITGTSNTQQYFHSTTMHHRIIKYTHIHIFNVCVYTLCICVCIYISHSITDFLSHL